MEINKTSNSIVPPVVSVDKSLHPHDKRPIQEQESLTQGKRATEKAYDENLTPKKLLELVNETNQIFKLTKKNVKVQVHESLKSNYVQILNSETDQVLSEIPAKKFLNMVAKFQEAVGMIIDEKI